MATSNFVKKAQSDIYENGKEVSYVSQKGQRVGQTLFKTDRTQPENKDDKVLIKKGESYYWWQFKIGPKNISKTAPTRSQLTRSGFLSGLYSLQDRIGEFVCSTVDEFENFRDEIKNEIEEMRDQCQESLDNMPDGLRESSQSGELLQERIDALESWVSEVEGIDVDFDESACREEVESDDDNKDKNEDEIQDIVNEKEAHAVDTALNELKETDSGL